MFLPSAFQNLAVESRSLIWRPVVSGENTVSKLKTKSPPSDLYERLCRARQFMDESYDLPLDLAEISKQACLSRYHFLRLFRDTFDTTPHQYLIRRRIDKAKELLRSRRLSVTDVCFEVGFQSLGSFSALFRKCVGDAPINYRRRERESQKKVPGCFIVMFGLKPSDQ
jgi:AraC-like DNA-binding protein